MESVSSSPITSTFSENQSSLDRQRKSIMGRINNTTQTGASLSKSYLLIIIKKSIKFAISFSLFSFLVSYFSLVILFLKPSETSSYYFAPQILDKSYMFLLCNGILVFLAKNSGLIDAASGDSSGDSSGDHFTKNGPIRPPEKTEQGADVSGTGFLIPAGEDQDQENGPVRSPEEGQEADVGENGFLIAAGEDQENEPVLSPERGQEADVSETGFLNLAGGDQENNGFLIGDEKEMIMSAEELNRKCDEFIKKMKEGIKLESRQVVFVR